MGPQDRRKKELEDRRRLILDKSRDLFFRHGFDKVTIQDICDAVEYGRSALYSLFESKEELYSHIYIGGLEILIGLSGIIDPEGDFDTEFLKMGRVMFDFYDRHTDYFKALSHFSTKGMIHSKIPPYVMEEKERLYGEAAKPIETLLRNNIGKGTVREIDTEEFIMLFYASVIGIISLYIFSEQEGDREVIHRAVMTHTRIYRDGIKK